MAAAKEYVHLHLHTHYSFLDGMCQVGPLTKRAGELGYKAMAITDHGNMCGAMDFYTAMSGAGIKPIIGFESYVAVGSRFGRSEKENHHLVLLASNLAGYHNLCRLCSAGYTEGFYYKPRIDKELIKANAEGLIALSGCLGGEIPSLIAAGKLDEAERVAREYQEIFGKDNFFLEIQNNKMPEQIAILKPMRELSQKTGIPLVATSDVHYIKPEHAKIQDIMLCINTVSKYADEKRFRMESDDFYLKSPEEMYAAFPDFPDAVERTVEIASRCNFDVHDLADDGHGNKLKFHLPTIKYDDDDRPPAEIFEAKCMAGLRERYPEELTDEVIAEYEKAKGAPGYAPRNPGEVIMARYEKEKNVILKMGFPSYFLMVYEIVNFAKSNGIPVGPGRGSAAGSIVAYALRITDLDPIKYKLLFERFLNEGRNEMPDIDLDFEVTRRGEIPAFIKRRFGPSHCAQIITFGKISVKSAVKDVGRVLDIPLSEVNAIGKLIPDDANKPEKGETTVDAALRLAPDLKERYDKDATVKEIFDIARELDGVIRQTGIHAAGVLVADRPLIDTYGPLYKSPKQSDEEIAFQYDMKKVEKIGLCKVDVLGLETLTLIQRATENIVKNGGPQIDMNKLEPFDDEVFAMLARGDCKGVFQFEGDGFRRLLMKMKPDRFEDLIAGVAMYRPGPLNCGMVDRYIDCKHGRAKPNYPHPMIGEILEETYGEVLYQEQVQALALRLAHFTLSEGDLMRRAMGKKIKAIMDEYKDKFVKQAHDTVGEEIAAQVFDQVEQFAAYGFNKSHSACYAFVSYQTAWLKCHYPCEYMAALLTINRGSTDKVVMYTENAEEMGIKVLPPDVNESGAYFTVTPDKNIRYGLTAIKGVGDAAIEGMEQERAKGGLFKSLFDFCERVDLRAINKGTIEAMIKAGAFDSLGGHRAQYVAALEKAIQNGQAEQKNRASGQESLFGGDDEEVEIPLPDVPEWEEPVKLQFEKEVLGFYASNHPLSHYSGLIKTFGNANTASIKTLRDKSHVTIGGMIGKVMKKIDKNDRQWAIVTLEDLHGTVDVLVFAKSYEEFAPLLTPDALVFVSGEVSTSRDPENPSIMMGKHDRVTLMDNATAEMAKSATIALTPADMTPKNLSILKELVEGHGGSVPLFLRLELPGRDAVLVRADKDFSIAPTPQFCEAVKTRLGDDRLSFSARAG
ncbi:MAG: DNA polymerase III subunit alpha [Planctomycetes bacterium]|nr:DNA polymerase III subunit alpha [Planctomycetota bacterium]